MKASGMMFMGWIAAICVCVCHFIFSRDFWRKNEVHTCGPGKGNLRELYAQYHEDDPRLWNELLSEANKEIPDGFNLRKLFHDAWGLALGRHGKVDDKKWGICNEDINMRYA